MARILSISYDEALLRTRQMLLEQAGHSVDSALGFTKAIALCSSGNYELAVIGHSIALDDKIEIIKQIHQACDAPVLALERSGEGHVPLANFYADPFRPEEFLQKVAQILRTEKTVQA